MKPAKNKPILITGAAGFIGLPTVEYFLEQGYAVHALVRNKNTFSLRHPALHIYEGDIADAACVDRAGERCRLIVHLAAEKLDETTSYATNVIGAKNIIAMARRQKIRRIVVVSTESAKIKKKGLYAATKDAADQLFLASNLGVTILRASIVYGPAKKGIFGSIVKFAAWPFIPVIGDGKHIFRPIYIDDLIKTIDLALQKNMKQKMYDVGGPDKISFNKLIQTCGRVLLNKEVRLIHVPVWMGLLLAALLRRVSKNPPITRSNILGSTQNVELDTASYFRDFKFIPRSLNDGLAEIENPDSNIEKEARLLYTYVSSCIRKPFEIRTPDIKKYEQAVSLYNLKGHAFSSGVYRYPFLLGWLDSISRIRYPHCSLQKKILIAAALIECTPFGGQELSPRRRSLTRLLLLSSFLTLRAVTKSFGGFILLGTPGFLKKNVS